MGNKGDQRFRPNSCPIHEEVFILKRKLAVAFSFTVHAVETFENVSAKTAKTQTFNK